MIRLTQDDYDDVLAEQGGGCAICGRPPGAKRFAQDHDHKTGAFRGLLCAYDNRYVVGRHTDWRIMQVVTDYLRYPPAEQAGVYLDMGKGPTQRRKRRKRARRTR